MRPTHTVITKLLALLAFLSAGVLVTPAQTNQARSMVTQPVNESQMVMRSGSTHPLARAEFDRGLAPDSLPMDNMMLGLKRTPEQDAALTPREIQVLSLLAEGASNKSIARRLGISVHTVKFHVAALLDKFEAIGRTDAVAHALRLGVIDL